MTDQAQKISLSQMDYWIVGQLRGQVLRDVEAFIPENYFDQKTLSAYAPGDTSTKYLNSDLQWAHNAGNLGRKLTFEAAAALTARQIAASEVLLHLALLAAAKAMLEISKDVEQRATKSGRSIENPNLEQLPHTILLFESNLQSALSQYLLHLPQQDAAPFLPLLTETQLSKFLHTRDRFMSNNGITVNGNVGVLQTGEHAIAHVNQNWTIADRESLRNSLSALSDSIQLVDEHELSEQRKREVKEQVETILNELKSSKQTDQPSLLGKIKGLIDVVQTIESLKTVTQFVISAIDALG